MRIALCKVCCIGLLAVLSFSCRKDNDKDNNDDFGKINFKFTHLIFGQDLQKDTMKYVNAANNVLEINEIKYFISDVVLHNSDGSKVLIDVWKDIHYVDIDIPSSLTWNVFDDIPAGNYDSVSFIFGISEAKNKSFMFVNPPEVNMMWPDVLGGGYHYMMINGKWKDTGGVVQNYDFHLGIGQLYKSNAIDCIDSIYAFVQNYYTVSLTGAHFSVEKDMTRDIEIIMNVESWFVGPHVFDFNFWGGSIMQNQPAMQMAKENGFDVFSVGLIR